MTTEELTTRVVDLEERAARHTEQIKTIFNQITDVRKIADGVQELALAMRTLAIEQKEIGKKVSSLSEDMEEIRMKPAKRWDLIVTSLLSATVTAIGAYILAKMGL